MFSRFSSKYKSNNTTTKICKGLRYKKEKKNKKKGVKIGVKEESSRSRAIWINLGKNSSKVVVIDSSKIN